jgi:hypothetical protein
MTYGEIMGHSPFKGGGQGAAYPTVVLFPIGRVDIREHRLVGFWIFFCKCVGSDSQVRGCWDVIRVFCLKKES